jgi:hypothetical protein
VARVERLAQPVASVDQFVHIFVRLELAAALAALGHIDVLKRRRLVDGDLAAVRRQVEADFAVLQRERHQRATDLGGDDAVPLAVVELTREAVDERLGHRLLHAIQIRVGGATLGLEALNVVLGLHGAANFDRRRRKRHAHRLAQQQAEQLVHHNHSERLRREQHEVRRNRAVHLGDKRRRRAARRGGRGGERRLGRLHRDLADVDLGLLDARGGGDDGGGVAERLVGGQAVAYGALLGLDGAHERLVPVEQDELRRLELSTETGAGDLAHHFLIARHSTLDGARLERELLRVERGGGGGTLIKVDIGIDIGGDLDKSARINATLRDTGLNVGGVEAFARGVAERQIVVPRQMTSIDIANELSERGSLRETHGRVDELCIRGGGRNTSVAFHLVDKFTRTKKIITSQPTMNHTFINIAIRIMTKTT